MPPPGSPYRSQIVDVTKVVSRIVRDKGVQDGMAIIYVPHTTAGVTINVHADPAVARDFESALVRIVGDGWGWQHVEEGEENAPSHIRASLMGPQVLIPLRDGELAQAIEGGGRGEGDAVVGTNGERQAQNP